MSETRAPVATTAPERRSELTVQAIQSPAKEVDMLELPNRRARRWFAGATLATLCMACRADEPSAPIARPAGEAAGTQAARDLIGVPITVQSNRFAYFWADQPQAASYSPASPYSYNATGGAIQIIRDSTGSYSATIDGIADSTHHRFGLSVVAYGASTIACMPFDPPRVAGTQLVTRVRCFDRVTRANADSRFSMLVVGPGSVQGRSASAYTWGWAGSWTAYTPDSSTSFTTGPNPIVISYNDPSDLGNQNVTFGTGNTAGTIALLTPTGNTNWPYWGECQLAGWLNSGVDVRCFDRYGAPSFAMYYAMQLERGRSGRRFGFAHANHPSTDTTYTPAAGHSSNSSGGAVRVTRTAVGRYTIAFDGLQKLPGHTENVQVTAFGGDILAACNVVKWMNSLAASSLLVLVECRRGPTGAYRDVKFNVAVIE